MTDIECPRCGHRALSVATRCPRCGEPFPAELIHPPKLRPDRPWLAPALAIGGGIVALAVLGSLLEDGGGSGSAVVTPPTAVAPDSAPAVRGARDPDSTTDGARLAAPAPAPAPAATPVARRRYATTGVNVRESRRAGAREVRVLDPGEPVLVDSLVGGWYRVVEDGRTLGYAHRRFLGVAPPASSPAP
ncbi:MAG TPA: SH3 domain-containing protein [Gemmatimonadales bacterium]|nr:SH3 domain-containing protein [Gemmatimonadales bacterium]